MNLNDIASIPIKGSDYTIHFWYMNMDDAITIMKNSDLNFKKWNVINSLLHIKIDDRVT